MLSVVSHRRRGWDEKAGHIFREKQGRQGQSPKQINDGAAETSMELCVGVSGKSKEGYNFFLK